MKEQDLQEFGLSEKQAAVYLALLKKGPSTPLQIAHETSIKRPTVYLELETLKARGLVEVQAKGIKSLFAATDPLRFADALKDKEKRFAELLSELRSYYKLKGSKNIIKYYEGIDGVKEAYESMLRDIRTGDPFYIIADTPNWHHLDYPWLEQYSDRRSKRTLDIRVLLKDSKEARQFKAAERAYKMKVKIFPHDIVLVGDILISPQKLILHNFTPPITAAVIEHEDLINTHINLFNYLWNSQ